MIDLSDNESEWEFVKRPFFNWVDCDYRIKKPKVSITIEKWLIYDRINNYYSVEEASKIFLSSHVSKVKLLETYKIEL